MTKICRGFLLGTYDQKISTTFFVILGIVLSILVGFAFSYSLSFPRTYVLAGIIGFTLAFLVFRTPELGWYLLIVSVFTNISNILTDKGLPAINQPLIAIISVSILANYILRTGKYSKFPSISRTEWALLAYYAVIVISLFQYSDKTQAYNGILGVTKDIFVGICLFLLLDTKEKWETGVWILIIVISILSLLGVYRMATGSNQTFFTLRNSVLRAGGQAGNLRSRAEGEANIWAQVLIAVLPLIIYRLVRDLSSYQDYAWPFSRIHVSCNCVYGKSRSVYSFCCHCCIDDH